MTEKYEWNDEERNEHLAKIKHKLKNKKIKEKLELHLKELQSIFECPISVSLIFGGNDEYNEYFDERDEYLSPKKMSLSELVTFLNTEDQSLNVYIDPIYLKNGINEISNVLLTTLDDRIIIVPQID